MRTRVKICGITRAEDARVAVAAGVDALGLVFYRKSPRHLELAHAQAVIAAIPAFVQVVALFKDAGTAEVDSVLQQLPVNLLQFHGSESAGFCEQFQRPYIKALGMLTDQHATTDERRAYIERSLAEYTRARGFLLDAHAPGEAGGTGESFDWEAIVPLRDAFAGRSLILAGGLRPGNVARAIATAEPDAVDVSSGVESAPGIKDETKIRAFMQQAQRTDTAKRMT